MLKIAFVTGSLELGRDGVGDYTRSLAQECIRQGHECCLVALNDRYVSEPTIADSDGLKSLRLPATMPWPQRILVAQGLLANFAPDWVSLQFVPYAFQPKGLVFGLAWYLQSLIQKSQFHIMFHETWIGELAGAPFRHRVIGRLQKHLVVQMTRQLQPAFVHTSNTAYQGFLQRNGIAAHLLPIFGSIPIVASDGGNWLLAELSGAGVTITQENRNKFWLVGFFGALPPDWAPEPLFSILREAAAGQERQIVVLSAGDLISGETLWQDLTQRYSPEFQFHRLGRQPAEQVSRYLNSLDLGVATTDGKRIGKSSAVAAMLDHGLPVIVSQDQEQFPNINIPEGKDDPLLYRLDRLPSALNVGLPRQKAHERLPDVAAQFVADLTWATEGAEGKISRRKTQAIAGTRTQN